MEEIPRPTMQSMAKTIHFLTKLESQWRHSELHFHMELAMEQMINQMNHFNLHELQPKASKNRNLEKDLSIVQCYKCRKMKQYSKECPNLPALPRENVNFYTWNFFLEEKSKVQILTFLRNNQILIALMRKINENLIIQNLILMEQKLMKDMILKESVFEMCGNIFVLIKDHLAKQVYLQGKLEECPHILVCV